MTKHKIKIIKHVLIKPKSLLLVAALLMCINWANAKINDHEKGVKISSGALVMI